MVGKVHDKVAAALSTKTASRLHRPILHALCPSRFPEGPTGGSMSVFKFVFFIFIAN